MISVEEDRIRHTEYCRGWRERNHERIRQVRKLWTQKNLERERLKWRAYRFLHANSLREHYFGGNRATVLKRDKYMCQKCGMTDQQHRQRFGKSITVDHRDGRGTTTPPRMRNNDLSNLWTLCLICHGRKDAQVI